MRLFLCLAVLLAKPPDVPSAVEPLWKKVVPKAEAPVSLGWRYQLTPPIPAQWPPKAKSAPVIIYAWGTATDPSMRDGERSSAPFASVELKPDGSVKATPLTRGLEKLETQGVHPITAAESRQMTADILDAARAGQMDALKATWCLWRHHHAVVSRHLEQRHSAFFAALHCDVGG